MWKPAIYAVGCGGGGGGGGGLAYEKVGGHRQKIWIKLFKETNLGVAWELFNLTP